MSHAVPGPADQDRDRRRPWWLWLLLGLLAVALLSLLLSQCGTDDDGDASSTTPGTTTAQTGTPATGAPTEPSAGASTPSETASSSATAPSETSSAPTSSAPTPTATASATASPEATATSGAGGSAAGRLVAGDTSVLADGGGNPATALAGQVGENATATRVPVQSVPADEGFWVGTSETDRAWVQLTGDAGESAYQVKEGDVVDFTGKVVAHGDRFPSQVGVSADEGSEQLIQQKAHIAVPKDNVKLSD